MSEQDDKRQFEMLLGRLTEGGLDDAQFHQLGRLIESDGARRTQYLHYCQMHGLLRAEHGLLASWGMSELDVPAPQVGVASRRLTRALPILALAAVLLVAIATVLWINHTPEESAPFRGEVVALLKKQVRARFEYGPRGEATPLTGAEMPEGPYELTSGIVELQSNSGVVLTLESPASFTLLDDDGMRIDAGRVAAHVPKSATGFRVEIPNGTVIDLGTDFAVEAIEGEKSEVHVFKGEVQINLSGSKATGASPLHLTTGEATKIDFLTGMPSGIDLDEQRFLRELDAEPHAYTQQILAMRPAVYYPMEPAGDGTHLLDVSVDRSDAQINFGNATEPVWATGKIGLAFAMGGPAQQTYATVAEYPQAEGDQLSVVAWVAARSRPRWGSIAKNWAGSDQWGQFHFGLHYDSGELEAHIQDSSGKEITVKDAVPIPLNDWHHVAFVADGSTLRLYRNGIEVSTAPYRQLKRDPRIKALAIGTKLNLSADAPDSHDFNMWDGRLDELAIFNHALTAEQLRELYELGNAAAF
jgi:ferric-dicitrate binding protein FerR (iron transport regulator)